MVTIEDGKVVNYKNEYQSYRKHFDQEFEHNFLKTLVDMDEDLPMVSEEEQQ